MQDEKFYSPEDSKLAVNFVYGVDPVQPMAYPPSNQLIAVDAGTFFAPVEGAEARYDSSFTFDAPTQTQIVQDCDDAAATTNMVQDGEVRVYTTALAICPSLSPSLSDIPLLLCPLRAACVYTGLLHPQRPQGL